MQAGDAIRSVGGAKVFEVPKDWSIQRAALNFTTAEWEQLAEATLQDVTLFHKTPISTIYRVLLGDTSGVSVLEREWRCLPSPEWRQPLQPL